VPQCRCILESAWSFSAFFRVISLDLFGVRLRGLGTPTPATSFPATDKQDQPAALLLAFQVELVTVEIGLIIQRNWDNRLCYLLSCPETSSLGFVGTGN
jgi:hypothetical protein